MQAGRRAKNICFRCIEAPKTRAGFRRHMMIVSNPTISKQGDTKRYYNVGVRPLNPARPTHLLCEGSYNISIIHSSCFTCCASGSGPKVAQGFRGILQYLYNRDYARERRLAIQTTRPQQKSCSVHARFTLESPVTASQPLHSAPQPVKAL